MNISEQLHSRFATKSELAELEKALSAQTAFAPMADANTLSMQVGLPPLCR